MPRGFDRKSVQIDTTLPGPAGEPMIQLTYPTRQGDTLTLQEWIPSTPDLSPPTPSQAGTGQPQIINCQCQNQMSSQCDMSDIEVVIEKLRIRVKLSIPNLIGMQDMQFVVKTLGPAANQQMFTSPQDIPLTYSLPPAVEIPTNQDGVQEVTLVVTPQGYSPANFSVKKDVPVRLIFRQLGQVGCGNELLYSWGSRQDAELILASSGDTQILEFTPAQSGEFVFHCPHFIYQGVMAVQE
jgi:hypothetical protein